MKCLNKLFLRLLMFVLLQAGRTALDVSIDHGHEGCVQALLEAAE